MENLIVIEGNEKYKYNNIEKTADIMGCAIWFIVIIGLVFLK